MGSHIITEQKSIKILKSVQAITLELYQNMKTFKISISVFVILAAAFAESLAASDDCSNWTEWGQCSESCGHGFRERICKDTIQEGKNLKDTEFCQARNYSCDPNPCQNEGICEDGINTHCCICKPGFVGYNC